MVSPATVRAFVTLLHDRTGQELGAERSWLIETALLPLARARGFESLDRLATAMADDAGLAGAVIDALLNNETSFFRDRQSFETLATGALGPLAVARAGTRRLVIWCAGCSTGQEVYSIAMLIGAEPARWAGWTIDVIGTDISRQAIARAQAGAYNRFEIQRGLTMSEMLRWFDPGEDAWQVRPELRARVRLLAHNLLDRPPPGLRADVILCRNVLLYFAPAKRRLVFERFASVLAEDGAMMLGAGETVRDQSGAFAPDPDHRGLYRRADFVSNRGALRAAG